MCANTSSWQVPLVTTKLCHFKQQIQLSEHKASEFNFQYRAGQLVGRLELSLAYSWGSHFKRVAAQLSLLVFISVSILIVVTTTLNKNGSH